MINRFLIFSVLFSIANGVSPLTFGQSDEPIRASIMLNFNMKEIRENPMLKDINFDEVLANSGMNTPGNFNMLKVDKIMAAIELPQDPSSMQPEPGEELEFNFYLRTEFNSSETANEMVESITKGESTVEEIDGKKVYTPTEGDAPANLRLVRVDDKVVELGTKDFLALKDKNVPTDGLKSIWEQLPASSAMKLSVDLETNRSLFEQLVEIGKATGPSDAAPFLNLVSDLSGLSLALDFDSENLLMLRANAKDSSAVENLDRGLNGMLGMARFVGQQGLSSAPLDEEPKKVFGEILKSLKTEKKGNVVHLDVAKPDGFDEAVSGLIEK